MLRPLLDAVDARTGYRAVLGAARDVQVHGGARIRHAFAFSLVFNFILVALSGVAMSSVYNPSVNGAWGSVHWIEHHMALGSVVRGIHLFASDAMIVLSVLYLTTVFLNAGYRAPREGAWTTAVLTLLLLSAFGLTGFLLPWDQNGYWSTQVRLGIVGGVPGGALLRTLLMGGEEVGTLTLTRFYMAHVFLLPGAMLLILGGHIASLGRHGFPDGPRDDAEKDARATVPYWPHQALRDVVLAGVSLGVVLTLAILVGAPLEAPADPASQFEARPEWSFLFLFQLLKYLQGPLTLVGTVILPGLAATFLLGLPWIEARFGSTEGPPSLALKVIFLGMLGFAGILSAVALTEDAGNTGYQEARIEAGQAAERAHELTELGGIDTAGRVVLMKGEQLFHDKGCASCHTRDAKETPGPLLSGYGSAERIDRFLQNPDAPDLFGKTVLKEGMEPFEGSAGDRADLVAWLMQLSGVRRDTPPTPETLVRAQEVFEEAECGECHNPPGGTYLDEGWELDAAGPELTGFQSYEWIRRLLRDATHLDYFGGILEVADLENSMPPNPDLSSDELDLLVRWLMAGAPGAD